MKTAFMIGAMSVKWWQVSVGMFAIVGIFAVSELEVWPLFHSGSDSHHSVEMCS